MSIFFFWIIQQGDFYVDGEHQCKLWDFNEEKKIENNCIDKQLFTNCIETSPNNNNIYDYSSYNIEDDKKENIISLSKYRGNYICYYDLE